MKKHLLIALGSIALWSASALHAQTQATIPLPAQLLSARTIFLVNGGSNTANNQFANIAYTTVYQGLVTWNKYRLVSAPANADLSFEVSVVSLYEGPTVPDANFVQLVIRDPRSQALLWTITESYGTAAREKTWEKNVADAAARVLGDLNTFTPTSTASAPQPAALSTLSTPPAASAPSPAASPAPQAAPPASAPATEPAKPPSYQPEEQ